MLINTLLPLLYGAIGGLAFFALNLPAPFLSGGTIAIVLAAFLKQPVLFPKPLRIVTFVFLGLVLGGGVSEDTVSRFHTYPLSLLFLTLTMVAVTVCAMVYLNRVAKWDKASALFASIPGSLSFVLALASAYEKVAQRPVALLQSIRLFALVVILPASLAIAGFGGQQVVKVTLSLQHMFILTMAGTLSGVIAEKLKVPAGYLLGALVATAVLYGLGIVKGEFPLALQALCFLLMALLIGERFHGVTVEEIKPLLVPSVNGFIISIVVSFIGAYIASFFIKLPLVQILLAFAPGGIEAMMILALNYNLDTAYVGALHFVRFIGITIILPFAANYLISKSQP